MPTAFMIGDRVEIAVGPYDQDSQYNGRRGEIIDIGFDNASDVTGDSKDNFMYTVELEDGEVPDLHFRRRDLVLLEPQSQGRD